jgi:osmotically inducible lipoprotein OsmB
MPRAGTRHDSHIVHVDSSFVAIFRSDPFIKARRGVAKMKTVFLALTASSMLLLSACSGMNNTEQRVVSGTAIGAGVGAGVGALTGMSIGTGALIGAGAGAAGGYIVDQTHK